MWGRAGGCGIGLDFTFGHRRLKRLGTPVELVAVVVTALQHGEPLRLACGGGMGEGIFSIFVAIPCNK